MKRIWWLSLASILCFGCQKNVSPEQVIRVVKTTQVTTSRSNDSEVLTGTVCAGNEMSPSFRIPGMISSINVKPGQYVKKGDLIAQLDDRDYKTTAEATESKYGQVASEVGRVIELYERKSVAKNEYEKAISGKQTIEALNVTSQNFLRDTKLKSPVSGYVQSVNFAPNMMINAGMGVLTIVDISSLTIETNISAQLYLKQHEFKSFMATSDLFKSPIRLKLNYIVPKANNSQLYRMNLQVPKIENLTLAPGMAVEVIIGLKNEPVIHHSVPAESIFSKGGKSYVWVVDTLANKIKRVEVTTGNLNKEGEIIIMSGLNGSETIVTAGVSLLKEGDRVRLINDNSPTNIGNML